MTQSRIVHRLLRSHLESAGPIGEYMMWLSDSLVPAIGGAANSNNLSVVGGKLQQINSQTIGEIELAVPPSPVDLANDSIVFAIRATTSAAGAIAFNLSGGSNGTGEALTFTANPVTKKLGSTVQSLYGDGVLEMVQVLTGTTAETVGQEQSLVTMYDADTGILRSYLNGTVPRESAEFQFSPRPVLFTALTLSSGAVARDLHVIVFKNSGLPANHAALAASYHNNPLTKLSAWAE